MDKTVQSEVTRRMNMKEGFRVREKRRINMTGSGLKEEKNG